MLRARIVQLDEQTQQHTHHYHQVTMALKGRIAIKVNGLSDDVCRMRACVIPRGMHHEFAAAEENRLLVLDLDEQDWRREHVGMLAQLFEAPRFLMLDAAFLNLLDYAVLDLSRYDDPHLASSLGEMLLCALCLRLSDQQPLPDDKALDLERLETFVQDNLAQRITVLEMAQVACLSPSHFHAQFKAAVGRTPHQYLLHVRLERASRLLQETSLPLVNIAEECGFSSQSALTTAMRRYLGVTPRRLRDIR